MTAALLQRPTLVLNRNWQPVRVTSVARALVRVSRDSARIVDPADYQQYDWEGWLRLEPSEGDLVLRTPTRRLRVPEVVTLTRFDRVPTGAVAFCRRNVFKRDHYTCQYCGCQPGGDELTIDHVVPRSQGGKSTWLNCVLACVNCNKAKADRTPQQAHMQLRHPPIEPRWTPLYSSFGKPIDSWAKFISESYWNVELES